MMGDDELGDEFRELMEWDWVISGSGRQLHHLRADNDWDALGDHWGGPGVASCGVRSEWWSIPGLFTRMSEIRRCVPCSSATRMPPGRGSPKNDDACRPVVEQRIATASSLRGAE